MTVSEYMVCAVGCADCTGMTSANQELKQQTPANTQISASQSHPVKQQR